MEPKDRISIDGERFWRGVALGIGVVALVALIGTFTAYKNLAGAVGAQCGPRNLASPPAATYVPPGGPMTPPPPAMPQP